MKIVNRTQLMALPNGIIYSEYKHTGIIEGLYEKTETWSNTWVMQSLIDSIDTGELEWVEVVPDFELGTEFKLDFNYTSRDSSYDDTQQFAVYDKEDVSNLIQYLTTLHDKYPEVGK